MWFGGINGIWFDDRYKEDWPALTKLGKKFGEFQNSLYAGEWDQKISITAGELKDILREVCVLIKYKDQ